MKNETEQFQIYNVIVNQHSPFSSNSKKQKISHYSLKNVIFVLEEEEKPLKLKLLIKAKDTTTVVVELEMKFGHFLQRKTHIWSYFSYRMALVIFLYQFFMVSVSLFKHSLSLLSSCKTL